MGNPERQLNALDRQLRALDMRISGKTYAAIAKELGFAGPSGAFKTVMAALKKTLQEPANELRRLEISRLDELFNSLWSKKDRLFYVDRLLKIMERRAKLLGLDAPSKIAPTNPEGSQEYTGDLLSNDERAARLLAILKQAGIKIDE